MLVWQMYPQPGPAQLLGTRGQQGGGQGGGQAGAHGTQQGLQLRLPAILNSLENFEVTGPKGWVEKIG